MDQKTIDTYNKVAREYDEETADFWDRFPRDVFKKFTDLVRGRLLDVGSGPGRDGLILKDAGLEVVCIDASSEMVKIAKGRGLNAIEGDFMDLPFSDGEFDGVWAYTSLLHIPKSDIAKALLEIKRVLKTGGVLGVGMIEGEGEVYRESSGINMPRLFSFYKKEELQNILQENGFQEVFFEEFEPKTKKYLNFILIKK